MKAMLMKDLPPVWILSPIRSHFPSVCLRQDKRCRWKSCRWNSRRFNAAVL